MEFKSKKTLKKGFTIIEVSLFLALTGLITVALISGVSSNINSKRYTDSVQDFAEYLRNMYSAATYIRANNGTSSNDAVYGKLLVFGTGTGEEQQQQVISYDIIGKANIDLGTEQKSDFKKALQDAGLKVSGSGSVYSTKWQARIQTADSSAQPFTGSILIARSPSDNAIHTLYNTSNAFTPQIQLNDGWKIPDNATRVINFCIDSDDLGIGAKRRNVRIDSDIHNGSGIQLISSEGEEGGNACQ